jgi:hypothetical protein
MFDLPDYDSDIDVSDDDFVVGEILWALDASERNFEKHKVEKVVDFMLLISPIKAPKERKWIDKASENLIKLK